MIEVGFAFAFLEISVNFSATLLLNLVMDKEQVKRNLVDSYKRFQHFSAEAANYLNVVEIEEERLNAVGEELKNLTEVGNRKLQDKDFDPPLWAHAQELVDQIAEKKLLIAKQTHLYENMKLLAEESLKATKMGCNIMKESTLEKDVKSLMEKIDNWQKELIEVATVRKFHEANLQEVLALPPGDEANDEKRKEIPFVRLMIEDSKKNEEDLKQKIEALASEATATIDMIFAEFNESISSKFVVYLKEQQEILKDLGVEEKNEKEARTKEFETIMKDLIIAKDAVLAEEENK